MIRVLHFCLFELLVLLEYSSLANQGVQADTVPVTCSQDCTRLNRFHCQEAARVCGDCYYGYVPEVDGGDQCVIDQQLSNREIEEDVKEILEIENLLEKKDKLKDSEFREVPANQANIAGVNGEAPAHAQVNPAEAQVQSPQNAAGQVSHKQHKDTPVLSPPLIGLIVGLCVLGFVGFVVATVLVYRHKEKRSATLGTEYGANANKDPGQGDRKLAQSAQMYHFQHQRQQMMMLEQANSELKTNGEESESADDGEDGDYTVFECAGLAPAGEMEVPNPLYDESAVIASAQQHEQLAKKH